MQVTETKSEGLSREFHIALPAREIEEKISLRLTELARTAHLPGFRPGKVPVAVLRKKYGPSVMGEVLERAVSDSSRQALEEKGLRPATQPRIEITSFKDGGDLEYTIAVDLLPEIKPVDFSKIKLQRYVPETKDADIDKALANLAQAHGTTTPIKEDRAAAKGDTLIIDFIGRIGDDEFPGGKADGYELKLGSGTFIPGFEDQLIGVKAGDAVVVKVTFPKAYGAEELAGKDAAFDVAVKELRENAPAAINDALAKKLGMADLGALKTAIKDEQEREFHGLGRMLLKRGLLDALADTHDFEVPEKLLDQEFEAIWKQYEEQKKAGDGTDNEAATMPEDEQKDECRKLAERRVRLGLLLSEVGRANNIQISQEDINRQLMMEARRHPGHEKEVMDHFKKTPGAMQQLTAPVYEEKVVDFILELATVTDKKATMAELIKALEEDVTAKPKAKAKSKAKAKTKTKQTKNPIKKAKKG
ncbi:MAG: trigger factor [Rhodospirillales bacterium]